MSATTPHALDVEASALLVAVLDGHGGDLRVAFAVLCQQVTVEDVTGETFQDALSRALDGLFGQPAHMLRGVVPARPGPAQNDP